MARDFIDVPVGAMRAFEFVANVPGDWAIHCHKSHHTMNAMGHNVKNFIGVQKRDLVKRSARSPRRTIRRWGRRAWRRWATWRCRCPENTVPMMGGSGPFGPIEMGGMFSVVKVRRDLPRTITPIRVGTSIPPAPSPTKSNNLPDRPVPTLVKTPINRDACRETDTRKSGHGNH